jgi:hypothetical protein
MLWRDPSGDLEVLPVRESSFLHSELVKLQNPLTVVHEYDEAVLVKGGVSLKWESPSLVPLITQGGKGTMIFAWSASFCDSA